MKYLRWLAWAMLACIILIIFAWTLGALYYDGPAHWFAILQGVAILVVLIVVRPWWRKLGIFAAWFAIVLGWWLTLKPTGNGNWQPDVAQLPWAEIQGDVVTLHNIRDCDYRSEADYTARWETRTVKLSQLTGIDMAIDYWGSPWIAHPMISFQFADAPPLCFSIETRKKMGQTYSAIGGLYRQFELIYIVATERDVIRVRTNYRKGEDVYLYRTTYTPEQARERFLEYLRSINQLSHQPRWYNAVTTNCTTAIRGQHSASERAPWDWRVLVNGKGDEMMYERHQFVTDGLPFAELKRRAHINPAARAAQDAADFSALIRLNRPGMGATGSFMMPANPTPTP